MLTTNQHLILRPKTRQSADGACEGTPKIPKLRLDILLYTNKGAEALAKYLRTTKVASRRYQRQTSERTEWGTHHNGSSGETWDEAEEEN